MKIYPEKLGGQLAKEIQPLYIVSGDEPLLVQECCDEIRAALKSADYLERELFHVEKGFDWEQVLYSNNSLSLFAEKKILELRFTSAKPGEKGAKALQELLAGLSPDTCLLLVFPRIDASTQRTKWFKAIEAAGALIQVWPVEAAQLPRWIEQRLKRAGLRAGREAVQALADRIEGNLLAAVQEIERLRLLTDQEVTLDHVMGGVADSARYDVFLLIDAALAGNSLRAMKIVDGLKLEGVEPLYVNIMLAREIRTLSSMRFKIDQGESLDAAMRSGRVWDKRKQPVGNCLKRHGVTSLARIQTRLAEVDRKVKGMVQGSAWDELSSAVLALSTTS